MALSVASILVTQNLLLANETTKLDDVQVVTSASGLSKNYRCTNINFSYNSRGLTKKTIYKLDAVKDIEGVYWVKKQ